MIDFTTCERNRFRAYGGANGNKINIRYQGKSYMLKFPPKPRRGGEMSYTNGCVSEYLGCHIFAFLGFRVQETLLGTYTDNKNKEKLVVACGDFTEGGKQLIEFAKLKNTCIDSELNGYGTELSTILEAIEEQTLLPPKVLREFFWDQFIADAFLGNFDRHNGNWGVLVDENLGTAELAPVYDCGSCLYPQLSEEGMRAVLDDPEEIRQRIYVFPSSAIKEDGVKIPYAIQPRRAGDIATCYCSPKLAEKELGWKRKVDFAGLVKMMVAADVEKYTGKTLEAYLTEKGNK